MPSSSAAQIRRKRTGEEEPTAFELELHDLIDESDSTVAGHVAGDAEAVYRSIIARPAPPALDTSRDALIFQQLELDHYVPDHYDTSLPGYNGRRSVPIVRMFGVTDAGNSVACYVHGFMPYFFVPAPGGFKDSMVGLSEMSYALQ